MDGLDILNIVSALAIPVSIYALVIANKANKIAKEQPAIAVDRERRTELLQALQDADEQIETARGQISNGRPVDVDRGVIEGAMTMLKRQQGVYMGGPESVLVRFTATWLSLNKIKGHINDITRSQSYLERYRKQEHEYEVTLFNDTQSELNNYVAEFRAAYKELRDGVTAEISRLTTEERKAR